MTQKYSVTTETRDGVEVYILREGERARAEVAPQLGNNCFAFNAPLPVLEEIAWADFFKKPTSYGIPLLFPYPNRIRDMEFAFQGEKYRVSTPQHGFVRGRAWQVLEAGADENAAWVTSEFTAGADILEQFPFPFRAAVTYRLRDGRLTLDFTAANTGERAMPCGFGIHPYFRWPETSRLQVPARQRWELREQLPTGQRLDVDAAYDLRQPRDTAGLQLDDIYTEAIADADGLVRCRLTDEANGAATVVEFAAANLPHIVVYTAPAPRRALCIEPMSCPTDAFNLQARGIASDMVVLSPGDSVNWQISVYQTAKD